MFCNDRTTTRSICSMTVQAYDGLILGGEQHPVVPFEAGTGRSEPDEARRSDPRCGGLDPQVPAVTPE